MSSPSSDALAGEAIKAGGWSLTSSVARAVSSLVLLAALSRLLTPTEIGIVALAAIVVEFAGLLARMGYAEWLVQVDNIDAKAVRRVWMIIVVSHAATVMLLWASTPLISASMEAPQLIAPVRLMSLKLLFDAFTAVPINLAKRALNFRSITVVESIAYILGFGATSVILAAMGYGVWSLVWGYLTQSLVRSSLFYLLTSPPSLAPVRQAASIGTVLRYGVGLGSGQLINYIATTADYFVVGRWLGGALLGAYSRAYQIMVVPVQYLAGAAQAVTFPAFSSIHREQTRLREAFLRTLGLTTYAVAPISAFVVILAPALVPTLLGEGWDQVVIPLQVLGSVMLLRAAYKIADSLVAAVGAVYAGTALTLAYLIAVVGGSIAGIPWGLPGVAVGVALAIVLRFSLFVHLASRILSFTFGSLVRRMSYGVLCAALLAVVLWCSTIVADRLDLSNVAAVALGVIVAIVASFVMLLTLPPRVVGPDLGMFVGYMANCTPNRSLERTLLWIRQRLTAPKASERAE